MCQKHSEILATLTALTSKNVKYDWKAEHQNDFDAMKYVIGREVFLAYPDFNAPFEIHNDDSKPQTDAVVSQKVQSHIFLFMKDEHLPTKLDHN